MMGDRRVDQGALSYEFSLERHVLGTVPPAILRFDSTWANASAAVA